MGLTSAHCVHVHCAGVCVHACVRACIRTYMLCIGAVKVKYTSQ